MSKRISSIKLYHGNYISLFMVFLLGILFFAGPFLSTVFAYGVLTLDVNIAGEPSVVETGEIITYIIDFSCGGVTTDCGTLSIDYTLDPDTEFIEVITSTGYTATELNGVVTIIDQNGNFQDGDASQAVVRVRVKHDLLGGETVTPTLEGTISLGPPSNTPVTYTQGVPTVTVSAPTEQWSVKKVQTYPPSIGPAEDGIATYQVQFCSDSATGNISLNNAQLVDTFPTGAVVVGNPQGGTVVTGPPSTISWALGTLDIETIEDTCVSRSYSLQYPVGTFPEGASIANSVEGFGDNPNFSTTGPCGTNCIGGNATNGTIDPPTVNPGTSKTGPGNAFVSPGGGVSDFFLNFNLNNANFPADNVIFTDTLPLASDSIPAISVMQIQSGEWDDGYQAVVEWQDAGGTWTMIGTVDGSANTLWLSGAGNNFPGPEQNFSTNSTTNIIYGVRWRFTDPQLPAGFTMTTSPVVSFIPREGMAAGNYNSGAGFRDYDNCVSVNFGVDGAASTDSPDTCANVRLSEDPQGYANINFSKADSPSQVDVLQPLTFTLTVELTQEASGDLINPTIIDVIPDYLEYNPAGGFIVTFTNVPGGEQIRPYLFVDTVTNAPDTRLVFYWDDNPPIPGSITFTGANAVGANDWTLTEPSSGVKRVQIAFDVTPNLNAPAGSATNNITIVSDSPNLFCQTGATGVDVSDIDGDLNFGEATCGTSTDYVIREAAQMISQKWIRSIAGPFTFRDSNNLPNTSPSCPTFTFGGNSYTRYPCVAQGIQGGDFETLLRIQNTGLTGTDNYILYDVLPHVNDTGVSQATSNQARLTEFDSVMTGPISIAQLPTGLATTDFTIEYSTAAGYNGCRTEMSNNTNETADWQNTVYGTACVDDWTLAGGIGNWEDVTSFRIVQDSGQINANGELLFIVPMRIPSYLDGGTAETGEITWNQFAQRFSNAGSGTRLLTAEPRKVGIVIVQEFSIGNVVFADTGVGGGRANDGLRNGTEPGIRDITMQLYLDADSNNNFNPAVDTLVNMDITDINGFYLFESDSGGNALLENRRYFVRIDPAEFGAGGDLVEYVGSFPQFGNNNDKNDNGNNGVDGSGAAPVTIPNYASLGIVSNSILLTRNGLPTNEHTGPSPELSGDAGDGPFSRGNRFQEDRDSNLTIDFGVYKPHSIGNRVWFDDGGGNLLNQDNGVIDAGEVGIDGVLVELFVDTNNNGVVEPNGADGGPFATTTTANGGYYLFDLLAPDQYVVHIAASNFAFGTTPATDGPLSHYITSTGNTNDTETDNDDNGIDPASEGDQRANGVFSVLIDLEMDGETILEATADKDGTLAEPDGRRTDLDSSELTVDFGFFEEVTEMSLGNRVWYDNNNNGTLDPTETGIDGVTVLLYIDDDSDGNPDGPSIQTQITSGGGYYLFDNLNPGRYLVQIPPINWTSGTLPLENFFSSTPTTNTENVDNNDNGINQPDYASQVANGIFSTTIQLVPQGEPVADDDTGSGNGVAEDNNGDNTVDFGFYKKMSLGNLVWIDQANTNGAEPGDGIFQPAEGEAGIDGIRVELYEDDGDGIFNSGTDNFIGFDTTANGGFYLFEDLSQRNYFVHIPNSNFTSGNLLFQYYSSDGVDGNNIDDTADDDDNGVEVVFPALPNPATDGVTSALVVLERDNEPAGETRKEAGVDDGVDVEPDNSDLTKDFGFFIPPMSIGNRVWFDRDRDGLLEPATEVPLDGITMFLYRDDGDGVFEPNAGDGAPIQTNITHDGGYYIFSYLPPGDYFVQIDPAEFASGDLVDFISTTTGSLDELTNYDDNGIDPPTFADYATVGVVSNVINLAHRAEPTTDNPADDLNPGGLLEGANGRGTNGEEDDDSNLSIDFGLFMPFSIGNNVWRDNGQGAGGGRLDGIKNGTEAGIGNVVVSLYRDADANNTFDRFTDTPMGSTTTDVNGYYVFDNLPEGTYFVWINDVNFQSGGNLFQFDGSPGNGVDDQTDIDDNGIDDDFPATNGIVSSPIVLLLGDEPVAPTETDFSGNATDHGPNFRGLSDPDDDNSDLTIDFGFDTPRMSIGNRVWFDTDNSGVADGADIPYKLNPTIGIAGVRVDLYLDANNDGIAQVGEIIKSDTTDTNGYYLFDDLAPGLYFVGLNELNFRTGSVLADLYSSTGNTGDTQTDIDDNGIDDATPETGGIISVRIELGSNVTRNSEPTGETDLSLNPLDGAPGYRGNTDELDSNSDLTIDFGLYKPMSIGNRVWFDPDMNGLIDLATESGIAGVTLDLYRDDGDGVFEPGGDDGAPIDTDTTDAEGFYLFDDPLLMVPGTYFVYIPASNFTAGALTGLRSTVTIGANDNNDNGIDDPDPSTNGIVSNLVTLAVDGQPTGESNFSNSPTDGPNRIGNNGQTDANSDITIDFGFAGAQMSLGNRVWLDPNNSGTIDGAEGGIAGVTVTLYRDTNADGIPNGAAIATDVTDANGYYLFGNLAPGNYVVALGNSNFTTGSPLNGLISSTGNGVDDEVDSDDNGLDTLNATYGLLSSTINLAVGSETDLEGDLGPEGDGPNGETPPNSELTIDFGLYRPMSIGNRVWLDTDNNGRINGSEVGVGNVIVNLYRDDNNDGLIDVTEFIGTDTTDANGFYIFDGLGEGKYIVEIESSNFNGAGALLGLNSSTGSLTTDADSRDKGIDDAAPETNGILSSVFTLINNSEPTNDTNLGPEGNGSHGETNANSNLSVDFGFFGLPLSLGNRVWIDDGAGGGNARDGIRDAGETLVAGARVSLYRDNDQDGVADGAAIKTDTTDANGYYLFDNLQSGYYLVGIDAWNFTGSNRPLSGYSSTTTLAAGIDDNDNGVDNNNPAVNGIFSDTVYLQLNSQPLSEEEGPDGRGANGETDPNSNLTVDFGFYKPMSLGNRVWFDPNNNGLIDAGEVGIAGVTVTLYRDDSDGSFDPSLDTPIGTDTTDSKGYYLFDDLDPGQYFVVIDDANLTSGVLQGFSSSTGATSDTTDSNDNGIDAPTPVGIVSNVVTLTQNGAPTNETDTSGNTLDGPNFRGTHGESNNNSDLSIDFGFVAGVMSIGNKVWIDTNDNGLIDTGELGAPNVIVNLYADVNQDGNPDGALIRTDTTDANGFYIFDGLPPGSYLVQVAPINFRSGGALQSLFSSSVTSPAVGVDNNDNGIDSPNPSSTGIFSNTVILVANNAPITELPADYGPEGNGVNGETDNNSNLTIDFGFATRYDLGDAPDSYMTSISSTGPQHQIVTNLYLGQVVDDEDDGQPSVGADGDDSNGSSADDEDGVTIPPLVAGTTIDLDFTVFNNTGSIANLIAWFDFNGNGSFDTNESFNVTVPSSATEQVVPLTIMVPISADQTTGGSTYARIRLTTDSINASQPGGTASDGEVEDYVVTILPPGVAMTKSDGNNSIVVGQETTYTITINNSGVDVINRNFVDNLPTGNPNGFIASSIVWTCTATSGASCISGQPAGTDDNGVGNINTFIDIPRNGRIVYELTATLNEDYSDSDVTNIAQIISGTQAEDVNGIIYDPPSGVKTGVALDGTHIRWTMVWLNTGGPQDATITDTLPNNQTFNGNLSCDAFGTSTTDTCIFNGSDVVWTGNIGTGNANRVEIVFDVVVSGDRTYRNTAEIDIGGSTAAASGRVRIGNGGDDEDDGGDDGDNGVADSGGGGFTVIAPALTKTVDQPFTLPGSTVTWTIQSVNDTDQTINNVVVTDNVPATLEILSGNSSSGDLEINGQTVTAKQGSLNPGDKITITLQTRVSRDIGLPFVVNNPATLTCDCTESRDAIATIISVLELPATGQSPYSSLRFVIPLFFIGMMSFGWFAYRKRNPDEE